MPIVESKPNVGVSGHSPRTRSRVPFSHHVSGTYRFGEYQPHFVMEAVEGDNIPLRSEHDIRTYTMKAPLMNNVSIRKDYFQVPMEAILPLNWDKIYTNPVVGDDVNASLVNCVLDLAELDLNAITDRIQDLRRNADTFALADTYTLQYLVLLERFFSSGSLFSSLGCHLGSAVFVLNKSDGQLYDFDKFFDHCMSLLFAQPFVASKIKTSSSGNTVEYLFNVGSEISDTIQCTYRQFLEKVRDDSTYLIENSLIGDYVSRLDIFDDVTFAWYDGSVIKTKKLNISRILAYQLACSHFYSNDKLDYIYSAELYRQNCHNCQMRAENALTSVFNNTFIWNGLELRYDYLAGVNFSAMLRLLSDTRVVPGSENFFRMLDYWRLILGHNRSLRFVDYFTGSKSQPLAVGDVNVAVNNQQVNTIDITRNIQRQRFFNWVNRTGRKFEQYVGSLGGVHVAKDWHNPSWLAHTNDTIFNQEVENTGSDQLTQANSVTTVMRSNAGKHAFEISVDRPSIIIGITYFDIIRYYDSNIERQWFHVNRFDMFNPFMQFIGDQEVYGSEIDASNSLPTFAYQLRHLEYKSRVSTAFGGFCNSMLPGYQFIADEGIAYLRHVGQHISPDYIRSRPSELDRFFVSLTGYSLGSYFHFIIDNNNITEPSRPMAYAPNIL